MPLILLTDQIKRSGQAKRARLLLIVRNLFQMSLATFLKVAAVEYDASSDDA
jgi:hypothetical protein